MVSINDLFAQLQNAVAEAQAKQEIRNDAAKALGEATDAFNAAQAVVEELRHTLNETLGELLPANPRVTVSR